MNAVLFEDDPMIAEIISRALKQVCDEDVRHFPKLEELSRYRSTIAACPGVLWMDIRAPDNTSEEAFDEVRAMRAICPDSIIVVMTGFGNARTMDDAIEAGADAFATKPFKTSPFDIAQLVGMGAIQAMKRGASDSPRVLQNVCSMAVRVFEEAKWEVA